MTIGDALDRLLTRLQPDRPVDAGLAEVGLMIDDPLEALIIRGLALYGPLSRTDLAAFVAASPRPRETRGGLKAVGAAIRRLARRSLIEGPDTGPHRLAERLAGRIAHFPRLAGLDDGEPGPPLDLPAAMQALAGRRDRPLTASALAELDAAADWAGLLSGSTPAGRALADWIGPAILEAPLRATLEHGMARVIALAEAALGLTPDARRAFAATWITFAETLGAALDPPLLAAEADRRAELLRRWAWFVGCPIRDEGVEPPLISAAALVRLDWRRIKADERALDVMRRAEAAADQLISAERKRREEAARAYASGRRE